MEDQPVARPLPTQDNTDTEETLTDVHASSGFCTNYLSVQTGENIWCLRPHDHCVLSLFLVHVNSIGD
jgi:hypothetical protein